MGTILNIIIISVVLDVALPFLPRFDSLGLRLAEATAGVVVTGIGGGIYLIANLGPGPRDGLMTGLQRVTGFPIAHVRGAIEVSVVITGWLLGGVVGAGTLLFAFGSGPVWRRACPSCRCASEAGQRTDRLRSLVLPRSWCDHAMPCPGAGSRCKTPEM